MIPNNAAFNGRECFEEDGKTFYRSYKIEASGQITLAINVRSINSPYRQGIAFDFSSNPKFKGKIFINGVEFLRTKEQINVVPVELHDQFVLEITPAEGYSGYLYLSNASDFLDDYPELIERVSALTGRTWEEFRGCSYTSGIGSEFLYANAFWLEHISDNKLRFHCNDHKMDDDFDDMIFDLEILKN